MPSRKATYHSQSPKARQLSAQPELAVRRASRFFCDHMRVFSEWATVQELNDIGLPYDVTREQSREARSAAFDIRPRGKAAPMNRGTTRGRIGPPPAHDLLPLRACRTPPPAVIEPRASDLRKLHLQDAQLAAERRSFVVPLAPAADSAGKNQLAPGNLLKSGRRSAWQIPGEEFRDG